MRQYACCSARPCGVGAGRGFSINLGGLFRADNFVFGWVWRTEKYNFEVIQLNPIYHFLFGSLAALSLYLCLHPLYDIWVPIHLHQRCGLSPFKDT